MDPYLVIGGGVSGIAAAHDLQEAGAPVELLEQDEVLGGRVAPSTLGEHPVELGGKNIGRRYHRFRAFAAKLGFSPADFQFFGINSSRVLDDGRLLTVDSTRRGSTLLGLLRSCPPLDLVRFARLVLQVMRSEPDGYLGGPYFAALGEKRDHHPLAHWFSGRFAQQVLRPLSLRMNGAEPDEVFLGNLGSNLRTLLDTYDQPRSGMRAIFDQFATRLPVHLGTRVAALIVRNGKVVAVQTESRGRTQQRPCRGVVLCTPAGASASLLQPHAAAVAEVLRGVRYYPVQVAVARYARPVFTPAVRAIVFGPQHPLSNAGAYGVDALDVVRYTFSGRTARAAFTAGVSATALLEQGEALLGRYVEVHRIHRIAQATRRFDPGLCAYSPRHGAVHRALAEARAAIGGLAVTGDYVRGASIEACFRAAHGATTELVARA
jgi:oxygen-dependent protoporphyrinogen oxidase